MQLSVIERIHLLSLLPPAEGDLLTLRITRRLREALSFTEEEHELYQFKQEGTTTKWDGKVEQNREVEIGEKAKAVIVKALEAAGAKGLLQEVFVPLYDKFVPEETEAPAT